MFLEWKVASLTWQLKDERSRRLALEQQIEELTSPSATGGDGDVYAFGRPVSERPIELRIVGRELGTPFIGDDDLDF
jgi:hypothetical protein